MWPFRRKRITQRLNTVDLNDDLNDVEMIMAIEDHFKIEIGDGEAEMILTFGDLCRSIDSKLGEETDRAAIRRDLETIVRDFSGSIDPIDEQTTFLPKYASVRE